jgi:hypothetical protein
MSQDARLHALSALDEAIELVRTEPPSRLIVSASPALAITWLLLFLYYLERVEGVRSLRPWFALALVLLWCARSVLLGRLAGRCVERCLASDGADPLHGPTRSLLAAAVFMGGELWLWLWLLIVAVHVDAWLTLAVLPVFALRGGLAPSWLAACDAQRDPSPSAVALAALRAADKQRLLGIGVEFLLLLGSVGLFFNLGALLAVSISLSQDLLGLDLSFVRAFISPSNHFALLGVAGLSLSAFEPLRAALSGVLFAEFRRAHEGVGVRALVQRCLAQGPRATPAKWLLVLLLALPARVWAQPLDAPVSLPEQDECDETCSEARARDDALLVQLVSILDGDQFREFPDAGWSVDQLGKGSLSQWIKGFWRWLQGDEEEPRARSRARGLPALPSAQIALSVSLGLLVLGLLLWLGSAWQRQRRRAGPSANGDAPELLPPEHYLQDALGPAQTDRRRALRALYLASLSGLSRRGLLTLSRELTNGHYLTKLPKGRDRTRLAELTALFDRAYYGALVPSAAELERSQSLARELVRGETE